MVALLEAVNIIPLLLIAGISYWLYTRFQATKHQNQPKNNYTSPIHSQEFISLATKILITCAKSDRQIDQKEIEIVTDFFQNNLFFNAKQMKNIHITIQAAISSSDNLEDLCIEFNTHFTQESKKIILQLVYRLYTVDHKISESENRIISQIVFLLQIPKEEHEKIRTFFTNHQEDNNHNYTVLGVKKGASLQDIKKAYRKRVKEFHPDKVFQLSEAEKKKAQKNMQTVNKAYEALLKEFENDT